MSRKLSHRGPDGEGIISISHDSVHALFTGDTPDDHRGAPWAYSPSEDFSLQIGSRGFASLAHRRLSVLDLSSRGHQPMCDVNGRYWITFNGEIYNFRALRLQMQQAGIVFNSETDTEVILAAYIFWGESMLKRLDGMFAFAIYDVHQKRLFCARDQSGVKPFLFVDTPEYFSFASEEKAFFGISTFSSGVRREAVFDFFVLGKFGHEAEGFFSGIQELSAGGILIYDVDGARMQKLSFRDLSVPMPSVAAHPEENFRDLFFDVIQSRMNADVPVGACLSGGLDSSSIVAAMASRTTKGDSFPLFTASFPGHSFDESSFASEVAHKFNGVHHLFYPNPAGLSEDFDNLIYSQDIPLWSTSTYAQHSVMKGVRESGIKVVLDGQGGDELLGGYHHHYYAYWRGLFLSGDILKSLREIRRSGSYLPVFPYFIRSFLQRELLSRFPSSAQLSIMRLYYPEMRWLNKDFVNEYHSRLGFNEQYSDLQSHLDQDFFGWRLKGYLKCEDRAAMWHSVESRTPFSDSPDLIRFCRSLPVDWKIHDGASKFILRRSMQGYLPVSVLARRDKIGYATPNKAWIKAILPRAIDEIISGGKEFFDLAQVRKDLEASLSAENHHDNKIFKFISFGAWRRIFQL